MPNKHKVPGSSQGGITWLFFSTLSSSVDKVIWNKLTSHPKHLTALNSFFSYFAFSKFSLNNKIYLLSINLFFYILNLFIHVLDWNVVVNCQEMTSKTFARDRFENCFYYKGNVQINYRFKLFVVKLQVTQQISKKMTSDLWPSDGILLKSLRKTSDTILRNKDFKYIFPAHSNKYLSQTKRRFIFHFY